MKKVSLLLVSILVAFTLAAQENSAVITFEKTSYDFGKIKEQDGPATVVFTFKNNGNAPLVINRVQASCGCTSPSWTKEPVLPGKSGTVTAVYNPANRPGTFVKSISVFSNASKEPKVLSIKGEVIPKPAVAP